MISGVLGLTKLTAAGPGRRCRAAALGALLLASAPAANAVLIDFDTAPLGPIAAGEYAALGVTFDNATVVSSAFSISAPQSIISTSGGFDWLAADAVGAVFDAPVHSVSITGANVGFNGLRLEAFDAADVLIDFDEVVGLSEGGTLPPNPPGEVFTLSVSGGGIARVAIFQTSDAFFDTIVLDNFEFSAVPAPATLGLIGLGLVVVGLRGKRRA